MASEPNKVDKPPSVWYLFFKNRSILGLIVGHFFTFKNNTAALIALALVTTLCWLAFNGNEETGDSSYGVFQINMVGELGPDRRDKFDLTSNVELFNPVTNSKITFHMTKGGKDWSAWSSVNGPKYQEWYNKYPCKS